MEEKELEIVLSTLMAWHLALMFYFIEMTGFSPTKKLISVRFYDFIVCLKNTKTKKIKKKSLRLENWFSH